MSYTGFQTTLLVHAAKYAGMGYQVGYTLGKNLAGKYVKQESVMTIFGPVMTNSKVEPPNEWDGISLLLDDLVCVDFDQDFVDIGWGRPLPPTFKEKSPRGYHLFYRFPPNSILILEPKIKWQPHVDLLVVGAPKKAQKYGKKNTLWEGHVLCSPTPGYRRVYPDEIPPKNQLTVSPDWLIEELSK